MRQIQEIKNNKRTLAAAAVTAADWNSDCLILSKATWLIQGQSQLSATLKSELNVHRFARLPLKLVRLSC